MNDLKTWVKAAVKLFVWLYGFTALAVTVVSAPLLVTDGFSYFAYIWTFCVNATWQIALVATVIITMVAAYIVWRSEQE